MKIGWTATSMQKISLATQACDPDTSEKYEDTRPNYVRCACKNTGRPNGITDREKHCELIMHVIADTDTDETCFGIPYSQQMQTQLCLAVVT